MWREGSPQGRNLWRGLSTHFGHPLSHAQLHLRAGSNLQDVWWWKNPVPFHSVKNAFAKSKTWYYWFSAMMNSQACTTVATRGSTPHNEIQGYSKMPHGDTLVPNSVTSFPFILSLEMYGEKIQCPYTLWKRMTSKATVPDLNVSDDTFWPGALSRTHVCNFWLSILPG